MRWLVATCGEQIEARADRLRADFARFLSFADAAQKQNLKPQAQFYLELVFDIVDELDVLSRDAARSLPARKHAAGSDCG